MAENYARTIIGLLYLIPKKVERSSRFHFENVGLTFPQLTLLFLIQQYGPLRITELSRKLDLPNSTVSGIVDRLEKEGLVVRKRDDVDRRVVTVQLTENVDHIISDLQAKLEGFFQEVFEHVPEEDLLEIVRGLQKLNDIFDQYRTLAEEF